MPQHALQSVMIDGMGERLLNFSFQSQNICLFDEAVEF